MIDADDFPRLTASNHRITSPATPDYNCIAWAAGATDRWWQPGEYWPFDELPTEASLTALVRLFTHYGYEPSPLGILDSSYEHVALYELPPFYTHAARQLTNGKWTSKLGRLEDIEHDTPDVLADGCYGEVAMVLRRLRPSEGS